jgi:hypothetical protein
MAKQEQLDILKQGVEAWNQWRKEHADIQPDLREAELSGDHLNGVDLSGANLSRVNLSRTNLRAIRIRRGANLSRTDLSRAILSEAILSGANLYGANLNGANLSWADLSWADLNVADLFGADLSGANLNGADLSGAHTWRTNFADVNLSTVKGLETVFHEGPSTIGIDTIYHSQGKIPEAFLREAGVPDSFIEYMRSLVGKPIDYYSCFISYSSKDDAFARRLCADLRSNHVRCWFAPEDLKWGERIRAGIDEAIRVHDKLLLILSKSSVASGWVEREVKTALARERKEKRTVLFPVRVDRAVFESPFDWATEIRRERNIGDFTCWKDHDEYQKSFARLLHDLQATEQLP